MARRNHVKSVVAGAGRQAGKGMKALAQQDADAAIKSVPKLKFDHRGECVLEGVTRQQLTGLRLLAARPDMKIKAETGNETPVWELVTEPGDSTVLIIHLRYNAGFKLIEESKRRIATVGRLNFHRGMADFMPETDEQEQGLLDLIAEQNRLAEKYGRARWEHTKASDGRYYIAKRQPAAS